MEQQFQEVIESDELYQQALHVVQANAIGRVWLIGGSVYRTLAALQHGGTATPCDFDFIVEDIKSPLELPDGWTLDQNRYGNPKLVHAQQSVDIVPIATIKSITDRGLEPTIHNFLTGTPFTMQSIAYDCQEQTLIGEIGLQALQSQVVAINNEDQALRFARKKGVPLNEAMQQKADSLGFTLQAQL